MPGTIIHIASSERPMYPGRKQTHGNLGKEKFITMRSRQNIDKFGKVFNQTQ